MLLGFLVYFRTMSKIPAAVSAWNAGHRNPLLHVTNLKAVGAMQRFEDAWDSFLKTENPFLELFRRNAFLDGLGFARHGQGRLLPWDAELLRQTTTPPPHSGPSTPEDTPLRSKSRRSLTPTGVDAHRELCSNSLSSVVSRSDDDDENIESSSLSASLKRNRASIRRVPSSAKSTMTLRARSQSVPLPHSNSDEDIDVEDYAALPLFSSSSQLSSSSIFAISSSILSSFPAAIISPYSCSVSSSSSLSFPAPILSPSSCSVSSSSCLPRFPA